jgi:hypothetical protein
MFSIPAYIAELDKYTALLIDTLSSVNKVAFTTKPNEDTWSIQEIADHVNMLESRIVAIFNTATTPTENIFVIGNDKLARILINMRARKVQAPSIVMPTNNSSAVVQTYIDVIKNNRQSIKDGLLNGTMVVTQHSTAHPYLGELSKADWLYFIVYHAERHRLQIEDLLENNN